MEFLLSDDLVHLKTCRNLSVLDLSYNRLEDPVIVDVLADMVILKGIPAYLFKRAPFLAQICVLQELGANHQHLK